MKTSTTAEAILNATIDLFRELGFNGTSMRDIVKASKTTAGSVYHFFPSGKDELTVEVIKHAGPMYQSIIETLLDDAADLTEGVYSVYEQAAYTLADTNYLDPCPIGGIAREVASIKPELRFAIAVVFSAWVQATQERLANARIEPEVAEDIAVTMVASIEGGFTLARTHRSAEPLLSIGRSMQSLVGSQLIRQGC
ncbi:MAG: TetR/AcrR family transcriptional regulator [Pseudomonadota bacterium]